MNAKMPQVKAAFEAAGFTDVKTVLASGNAVFTARSAPLSSLQSKAETAMRNRLGREFMTIVRPIDALREVLESDPWAMFKLTAKHKRVVTFVRGEPRGKLALPIELGGARILSMKGGEVFTAYLRSDEGPVFMRLIEKTFGKDVTTRTWETVGKVVRAAG